MSGHTPGPWKVEPGYYPGFLLIKGASFDISIVTTATDLDFKDYCARNSDAQLIASAPDLLEALENLENDAGHIPDHAWEMVKAAIAKAKGESK